MSEVEELWYTTYVRVPNLCDKSACNKPIKRLIHQQERGDNTTKELQNIFTFACIDHYEDVRAGKY